MAEGNRTVGMQKVSFPSLHKPFCSGVRKGRGGRGEVRGGVGWCGLGWAEDHIVIFNCDLNLYKLQPTDENCIKLVEQGVHEKLLNLLARSSHREVIIQSNVSIL